MGWPWQMVRPSFLFSKFGREIKIILPPLLGCPFPDLPLYFLALTFAELSCWVDFNGCAGSIKEKASLQRWLQPLILLVMASFLSTTQSMHFYTLQKQNCIVRSIQHTTPFAHSMLLLWILWRKRKFKSEKPCWHHQSATPLRTELEILWS